MTKIQIANPIVPLELKFINEFLPAANPTHVMVYIYALGLCYANKPGSNAAIAEALDILESDVIKAWKYWVKTGLIALNENGTVTFLSTHTPVEPQIEKPPVSPQPETEVKTSRREVSMNEITKKMELDKALADTLSMASIIWSKPLNHSEVKAIYSILEWYSLSNEVLLMLLEYCALEERTKNMKYMETVAEAWANDGIVTVKMAEKEIKRKQKERSMIKKCSAIFGLNRAFSDKEAEYISDWTNNMCMSEAMIKEAYTRTTLNTGKLSFQYMNKILSSWNKEGIKTLAALKESEAGRTKPAKPPVKDTRSSNYNFDDIEMLELQRRMKKSGQ